MNWTANKSRNQAWTIRSEAVDEKQARKLFPFVFRDSILIAIGTGSDSTGEFTLVVVKSVGKDELEVCYLWLESTIRDGGSDCYRTPKFNYNKDPLVLRDAEKTLREYKKSA